MPEPPGTIKFDDGSTINVNIQELQEQMGADWQKTLESMIKTQEKTRGGRLDVNVTGFEGNVTSTPDQRLHGVDHRMVDIRNPLPPFTKAGFQITEEGFKKKRDLLPLAGGFAEFLPGPGTAVRGAGLIRKGVGMGKRLMGGAPARAGYGAAAGKKGADWISMIHGVKPNQRTSALREGGVAAVGEAALRMPFAARRYVQRVFTAGAEQSLARANKKMLSDMGIEKPRLDQILKDAGEKHSVHESLYNWAARNFAGAGIIRRAAEESQRQIDEAFQTMWVVRRGQQELTPDVIRAGRAFARGYSKYDEGWREVATKYYADFFDKLAANAPPGAPTEWTATRTFLDDRASLEPVLRSLVPDKMKGLHNDFEEYYTKAFKIIDTSGNPMGPAHIQPVDFDLLKRVRTQVGKKISSFDPGQEIGKDELIGLYGALTEDMAAAAKKYGVDEEFQRANDFWKSHKEFQDGVLENISKKVSNQKMGAAVQSLVNSGDYQNLGNIKGALGPNSPEWEEIQNYVVREYGMGAGSKFDIDVFYRKWGKANEGTKRVLAGRGESRKALDRYVAAVEKWGPRFSKNNRTGFARFTAAETYGPAALLAGGAYGLGASGEDRGWGTGVAYGAVTLALALSAPRSVANLLVDPKYTDWAVKSFEVGSLEKFAGMVSRLGAQYKAAPPDQQAAVADFLYNLSLLMPAEGEQMQQKPGNPLGMMKGPQQPRGIIGGGQ